MTLRAIVTLFVLSISGVAYGCVVTDVIEDGSVEIFRDQDLSSNMYHVRAPFEFKGSRILFLILTATSETDGGTHEIKVPLSIKTKGEVTGSYFYLSSQWVNVRVSAHYEGMRCAELVADLPM